MLCGDETGAVVCDFGRDSVKFGFSGQDAPSLLFSPVVGFLEEEGTFIVDEARFLGSSEKAISAIDPFAEEGHIHWQAIEEIFRYAFSTLRVDPLETPLLISDRCFTSEEDRESLIELLFDTFQVHSLFLARSAVLASFCFGRPTSLVLDFGKSGLHVCPVVDGFVLERGDLSSRKGCMRLTELFATELDAVVRSATGEPSLQPLFSFLPPKPDRTEPLQTYLAYKQYDDLRRRLDSFQEETGVCEVEFYDPETLEKRSVQIPLPSSASQLCEKALFERRVAPLTEGAPKRKRTRRDMEPEQEAEGEEGGQGEEGEEGDSLDPASFFLDQSSCDAPALAQSVLDSLSVQELVKVAVMRCDVDVRKELLYNVLVTGGGVLAPGFVERLEEEIRGMFPMAVRTRVVTMLPVEMQFAAFIGGSILSSCGTFQQLWLSKQEYLENGSNLAKLKFPY